MGLGCMFNVFDRQSVKINRDRHVCVCVVCVCVCVCVCQTQPISSGQNHTRDNVLWGTRGDERMLKRGN
jgi:hypothetical protein